MASRTDWGKVVEFAVIGGLAYAGYLLAKQIFARLNAASGLPDAIAGAWHLFANPGVETLSEFKFPDGRLLTMSEIISRDGRTFFVGNDLHIKMQNGEWRISGRDADGRYLLQAILT